MPRMYGRMKHTWFNSCRLGCCYEDMSKTTAKSRETKQALMDAEDEMYEDKEKHARGMCYDPKSGYGCPECYDDYDPYDNSELDDVEGVWCNVDWRKDWNVD